MNTFYITFGCGSIMHGKCLRLTTRKDIEEVRARLCDENFTYSMIYDHEPVVEYEMIDVKM